MSQKSSDKLFTQNRELSWLKFNERVLSEAQNEEVPLLERLKFLSIFASNLDEFFMIRVGSLFELAEVNPKVMDNRSGMNPKQQLDAIYKAVKPLYKKKDEAYGDIAPQLRHHGIYDLAFAELEDSEKKIVKQDFKSAVLPVLSPQIIDSHHPFPHLQNNVLHIVASLKLKNKEVLGVIPLTNSVPGVCFLPSIETRYVRMENVICEYISSVFENYTVEEMAVIRVTRNEDINFDDDIFDVGGAAAGEKFVIDNDFRKKMKSLLSKRKRLAPVRMETSTKLSAKLEKYFCEKLDLEPWQIFQLKSPMSLGQAFSLQDKLSDNKKKALTYKDFTPEIPADIDMEESIIKQVQKRDLLLSYPFESMKPFLELVKEAANDPQVLSIKITIYRLANKTKLVEYLCAAAENGKDVTVLIELRARFDEQNNIDWSERLEEAGCNIIYGFEHYKVHSKICLITRREKNEVRYITQIGTGNYNEKTAKLYTDLTLLTYNQEIGRDGVEFFKNMGIGNLQGAYKHLLVGPVNLKSTILNSIEEQMALGDKGRIFIKINSMADEAIMAKLKEASCAGVKVKMVIRGICCLLPQLEGQTENIEISAIVGRFLEHSRIYAFGTGDKQKMYISSADFLTRNTERRVEVACPIYEEHTRAKITHIMEATEYDNVKARVLQSNGCYEEKARGEHSEAIDSQALLLKEAGEHAGRDVPKQKQKKKRSFFEKLRILFFSGDELD